MSEPLSDALTGVLVALCSALTAAIAILATYTPQLLRAWLESKTASLKAAQALRETSVADTSVAAAEEIGRMQLLSGPQKMELAVRIAAEKAPDAPPPMTTLQASVAKMRASVPSMHMTSASLAPGSMLSIPVQVVSSEPPASPAAAGQAPLPKPARVPWTEAEDAQTTRPRRP